MQEIEKLPFLSCLNRGAGNSHLKLSLIADDPTVLEKSAYPFLDITDSDPLARLLGAEFLTDSGSVLKKVFLLVQRDWHFFPSDELKPITNLDIDRSWQRAFSFHARQTQTGSLTILAAQIDEAGRLRAFQPAFFCKSRQLFFSPPCPRCGQPLEQCCQDELLAANRLQLYSSSLTRYLHCSNCAQTGESGFYTYEPEKFDPPTVRDRWALIREFGSLVERGLRTDSFPCADCFRRQECYGPESQSLFRIVPLSFYPFYMLIFDAMSLNAADFLALVGGASYGELRRKLNAKRELGRLSFIKSMERESKGEIPVLFESDSMRFGEILYLKLSFLAEFIEGLISDNDGKWGPGVRLNMDRLWVKLPQYGRLLPFLWNFRVSVIGFGLDLEEDRCFAGISKNNPFHSIGRLWFYAMLANKEQKIAAVYQGLGDLINRADEAEWGRDAFAAPVFLPENLFWDPQGKSVSKRWDHLWNKTLNLGWNLLVGHERGEFVFSGKTLLDELNALRSEIKMNLFMQQPEGIADQVSAGENEAIYGILSRILAKWQATAASERTVPEPQEELAETVILSLNGQEKSKPISPEARPPGLDDELQETVIISTSGARRQFPPAAKEVPRSSPAHQEAASPDEDTGYEILSGDDIMAETVILRPKSRDKGNK